MGGRQFRKSVTKKPKPIVPTHQEKPDLLVTTVEQKRERKPLGRSTIEAYVGIIGGLGCSAWTALGFPVNFGLGLLLWLVVIGCLVDGIWNSAWTIHWGKLSKQFATALLVALSIGLLTMGWGNTHPAKTAIEASAVIKTNLSAPAVPAFAFFKTPPEKTIEHPKRVPPIKNASLATALPAPTVGILGGKNSLVRNSRVEGFQIGIDQSRSDTGVVDHTVVVTDPPDTKPATTELAAPGNAKKHKEDQSYGQRLDSAGPSIDMGTANYIVFDHMIFEGTADIKNTDHIAIVNSEVILPSEAHQARMNVMNDAVMSKIRKYRNNPAWLRAYLAKMRAFFETRWTTLPRSQWDENENLFSDFEDSAEGFLFDEQKSIVLLDKLVEELPAVVQP